MKRFIPCSITEAGFLIALMLAPLGPVPRYFGWLIAIIGLIRQRSEVKGMMKGLPLFLKISFSVLLLWGGGITLFKSPDLFYWVKGWSLVVEFVFSVLLACFVLRLPGAFTRWRFYTELLILCLGIHISWSFFFNGHGQGIFPLHTFPSTITIPLFSIILLPLITKAPSLGGRFLHYSSLLSLCAMFMIGLSSGALVSNVGALLVFLLILRPGKKQIAAALVVLTLGGLILAAVLPSTKQWPVLKSLFLSEISQLSSFADPVKLTSQRNFIWEAALYISKRHPEGIGWGQFESVVKQYIEKNELAAKHLFPSIHNEFLTVLVEGGVLSFAAYFLFLGGCFAVIASRIRSKSRWMAALLGGSITGILLFALVGGIFDERQMLAVYFWTVFGAIISQHEKIALPEEVSTL